VGSAELISEFPQVVRSTANVERHCSMIIIFIPAIPAHFEKYIP